MHMLMVYLEQLNAACLPSTPHHIKVFYPNFTFAAGAAGPSQPSAASSSSDSSSSPSSKQQEAQQAVRDEATEMAAELGRPPSEQGSGLSDLAMMELERESGPVERSAVDKWLNPDQAELPGDFNMPIWVSMCLRVALQQLLNDLARLKQPFPGSHVKACCMWTEIRTAWSSSHDECLSFHVLDTWGGLGGYHEDGTRIQKASAIWTISSTRLNDHPSLWASRWRL